MNTQAVERMLIPPVQVSDAGVESGDVFSRAQLLINEAADAGLRAKPFCLLDEVQLTGSIYYVHGPDFVWKLGPIESYEFLIPHPAMVAMAWARAKGFSAEDIWVASPAQWDAPKYRTDPLLVTGVIEGTQATAHAIRQKAVRAAHGAKTTASGLKTGVTKTVSGVGLGLAALIGMAVAPLAGLATVLDPVLVVQVSFPTSSRAVLIELARWE